MESSKFTIGGGARRNSSFCFAFDVLSGGGILYAVPTNVLSSDVLLDAMLRDELGTVGPSKEFIAQMMAEEEIGSGIVEIEVISPCCEEEPNALPKVISVLPVILEWIESVASERVSFYSAREEQEALMQQQLSAVMTQQEALAKSSLHVAVAGYARSCARATWWSSSVKSSFTVCGDYGWYSPKASCKPFGPTAAHKSCWTDSCARCGGTCCPNSRTLCWRRRWADAWGHFTADFGDHAACRPFGWRSPTQDFASSSTTSGLGLNTKGVARREKMQSDLASRSSNYFLQVQQQLYERMNPARSIPKTAEELSQAGVSVTAYLGRYGGFRHCRDTGLIMWILAHAMDAVAQDDFHATKEFLALLTASLEQSALDNGCVAFVVSLIEEPPQQLSAERIAAPVCIWEAIRPFSVTGVGGCSSELSERDRSAHDQKGRNEESSDACSGESNCSIGGHRRGSACQFQTKARVSEKIKSGRRGPSCCMPLWK